MSAFDHPLDPIRAPRDGCTCAIGWINRDSGDATYDLNPAIGRVRCRAHDVAVDRYGNGWGSPMHVPASAWFPICAEHALRLREPDMADWEADFWYGADDAAYFHGPAPARPPAQTQRGRAPMARLHLADRCD